MKVAADSAGNLTATDTTTGADVFHAPAPMMWDSSSGTGTTSALGPTTTVKTAAFAQDTQASDVGGSPGTDDLSDGPAPTPGSPRRRDGRRRR